MPGDVAVQGESLCIWGNGPIAHAMGRLLLVQNKLRDVD